MLRGPDLSRQIIRRSRNIVRSTKSRTEPAKQHGAWVEHLRFTEVCRFVCHSVCHLSRAYPNCEELG